MGRYLPYSGVHSIQEAVIAVHFRGPFAICQLTAPRQTIESLFQPSSEKAVGLDAILDALHRQNGAILRDMLVTDTLKQIGMSV